MEQISGDGLGAQMPGTSERDMDVAELVRPIGVVTCPNCQVEMPRIGLKQAETEPKLREATYRCPRCETETRRWIAL